MRLIYGFLCLAIVAGCQTTCDNVSESSATSNHVSVAAVRYMASVGNAGAETVEVIVRNGTREPVSFVKAELDGVSKIAKTAQLCGDKIDIYSGNDDQIIPVMSIGGKGCISVLSNLLPRETVKMSETFFSGDVKAAAKMQLDFIPLVDALFSEVNPIPVKAAMAKMGFCEDYLRLPLTPMEDNTRAVLYEEMRKMGINI